MSTALSSVPAKSASSRPDTHWPNGRKHDPYWLGRRLVELRIITPEQFDSSCANFKSHPELPYSTALERLALASQKTIAQLIAEHHRLPLETITPGSISKSVAQRISLIRARQYLAIPIRSEQGILTVAVADPARYTTHEAAIDLPGSHVRFVVAPRNDIIGSIEDAYAEAIPASDPLGVLRELLSGAAARHASDIHFEPKPNDIHVRERIDGKMIHRASLGAEMKAGIIQAIKGLAQLDHSEKRLPQDGQAKHVVGATTYNLRISTIPTIRGEKAVIRLQDETRNFGSLAELGVTPKQIELFLQLLSLPSGLFYVTGPTGSGKTTLQYALLATQDTSEDVVVTAEDPVEYQIYQYNQCAIDEKIGRTFEAMLRAFMRQDPDYILIGETRDKITASVAIHAALTGHIVFSTLHTTDAAGTIARLVDMGIEPFLIASALKGVCATRLVRRLCNCATPAPADHLEHLVSRFGSGDYRSPRGCPQCANTGFRGRIAILEIYPLTDPTTQQLILKNVPTQELTKHLASLGHSSMRDDGIAKAKQGLTTITEVLAQV